MIGVLDPALLVPRAPGHEMLDIELTDVVQLCHSSGIKLPTLEEYWSDLWLEFGEPLRRSTSNPLTRRALNELQKLGRPPKGIPPCPITPDRNRVYGLLQMFDIPELGAGWVDKMTHALARASASGSPAVLITRRMEGRNLRVHQAENSRLEEVTRWVLYLHMSGSPPRSVYCFHHPRNTSTALRWTTRYDWRLPAVNDGARYPFCPPAKWWKGSVDAVGTMNSKPVFLDTQGNGWARPNINDGRGYHWDVYLNDPNLSERIGLSQLNIVGFGGPQAEKAPGSIHHISPKKKGRLRDDSGWSC
jgi:hypothetical protein